MACFFIFAGSIIPFKKTSSTLSLNIFIPAFFSP